MDSTLSLLKNIANTLEASYAHIDKNRYDVHEAPSIDTHTFTLEWYIARNQDSFFMHINKLIGKELLEHLNKDIYESPWVEVTMPDERWNRFYVNTFTQDTIHIAISTFSLVMRYTHLETE